MFCKYYLVPEGISYVLNGSGNSSSSGTLQVLNGFVNTPCFYLNPTGPFVINVSSVNQLPCLGGISFANVELMLSQTGSAAPSGSFGNYIINGTQQESYSSNPFNVNNLVAGNYTVSVTSSYGCNDTIILEFSILGY